jgi:hypothetical protein
MGLSLTNENNSGGFSLSGTAGLFSAGIASTALYDFSTFTFTNVGVTGSNPPLLTQFLGAYTGSATWASNTAYFTTQSGIFRGYQLWTVPQTATYEIEVAGASTGRHAQSGNKISSGSKMRARFSLQQNQKLLILVGQQSADVNSAGFSAVGGGGGTYVVPSGSTSSSLIPYIVAGGGGGNGFWSTGTPLNAYSSSQAFGRTTTYGGSSSFGEVGGVNGFGGKSHNSSSVNAYDGGGGGGFAIGVSGSGMNGVAVYNGGIVASGQYAGAGRGFWTGSLGGALSPAYTSPSTSDGGFGGGGGAGPICGGGGGGYSGGAGTARGVTPGTDGAGGGGSYISSSATEIATADGNYETLSTFSGSAITNIGYHSGSGYVKITRIA